VRLGRDAMEEKLGKPVTKKEAEKALLAAFEERSRDGSLHADSRDYFEGSYDRWSLVISELSNGPPGGRILDIGGWDGLFCSALKKLGYEPAAADRHRWMDNSLWQRLGIEWQQCNIEADPLPFPDGEFSGIYMGQIMEHFTYSPRKPLQEIRRVLKPGGLLVIDVPNAGELHNFYRLIRGKNILYDYKKHYIDTEPTFYKGLPYFDDRHNREFTANELRVLAESCGFEVIRVSYIRSVRHGLRGFRRLEIPFIYIRDLVPLFRKTVMSVSRKPWK